MPERDSETGATFAPDEIGWIDFESANKLHDIGVGTYKYVCDADAVIAAYAIGDGPTRTVAVDDFPQTLCWADMPDDFKRHHDRVARGEAVWAAWHAAFDKAVWNYAAIDFPVLQPHHIIDVMVQAIASGLAPDLRMAAIQSGSIHKVESGADLIKLFCIPPQQRSVRSKLAGKAATPLQQMLVDALREHAGRGTPKTHPELWRLFCEYAGGDIAAMRSVFQRTRQLPWAEWQHYWAGERINERGVGVDLKMVTHAAQLAEEDRRRSRKELARLTDRQVNSVDEVLRITNWLLQSLPKEGRDILTKRIEERDEETDEIVKPATHSLTRGRVERLIAYLQDRPESAVNLAMLRVLQIRLYGGSKTPMKYGKMLQQHVDGVLFGQYAFNGAPQTGRYSSKGVQVHNLDRNAERHEPDLVNAILNGCPYEMLERLGAYTDDHGVARNDPVSRKLALLIRPALVPKDDNVFVWSDWSQIEARITPWLAGDDPGALARLQIFRDVDANPKLPDLYTRTASDVSHIPIGQVTKPIRQRGKVAELALSFLGGVSALLSMAANYGLHLKYDEAVEIVARWRAANQWAMDFGENLWEGMRDAHHFPNNYIEVGRVGFIYLAKYLGGSMLMRLPSGRCLTYRGLRWDEVELKDEDEQPTGETELQLRCGRGYGRIKLWPGILVENCLAGNSLVLTPRGWIRLDNVKSTDRLWDGETWISHDGLIAKGVQSVIDFDGVYMTADHKVLTTEGWRDAASSRHDRASVRLPDGDPFFALGRCWSNLVGTLRLRQRTRNAGQAFHQRRYQIVRLQNIGVDDVSAQRQAESVAAYSRHVRSSSLLGMALDARSLPIANASGMAQLRCTRNPSVQALGRVQKFLGRYGTNLCVRIDTRTQEQQQPLHTEELHLDDVPGASGEHTSIVACQHDGAATENRHWSNDTALPVAQRLVYDIRNAGPRSCFVVLTASGPLLVHNCTQATAADFLRGTLTRLEIDELARWMPVRLHTHDEILTETTEQKACKASAVLRSVMRQGFAWSEGLPIMSDESIAYYYSKHEDSAWSDAREPA